MPDFTQEVKWLARLPRSDPVPVIVGVDEAGRGPWAGPVVAAAAWLDPRRAPRALLEGLNDSKTLSPSQRDRMFLALSSAVSAGSAALGIGAASVKEIDGINILQASLRAMARAVDSLSAAIGRPVAAALIDGPHAPVLSCPSRTVVRGDGVSLSIAAASIIAKVTRDRAMVALAARHPGYGWERNRGYGTAEHRDALMRLGVSSHHRRSFRPVRDVIQSAVG